MSHQLRRLPSAGSRSSSAPSAPDARSFGDNSAVIAAMGGGVDTSIFKDTDPVQNMDSGAGTGNWSGGGGGGFGGWGGK